MPIFGSTNVVESIRIGRCVGDACGGGAGPNAGDSAAVVGDGLLVLIFSTNFLELSFFDPILITMLSLPLLLLPL